MPVGEMVTDNAGVTINFFNKPILVSSDNKCHAVESEDNSAWVTLVEILAACPFSLPGIRMSGSKRFFISTVISPERYPGCILDDAHTVHS